MSIHFLSLKQEHMKSQNQKLYDIRSRDDVKDMMIEKAYRSYEHSEVVKINDTKPEDM
ncbi:7440_t:CDS:2 [Entrophospora sp. SA101]|nr:6827_t:CDS:2 [Entrophospora sp. SA101]CAJ0747515.1 7440_t:CDS:2 [Entrophospora sp. SA101]CAJ0833832.1 17491_t:CDS:2 [Entrophospora sp. SA101]CAJ0841333.1 12826_t:CDS:2 [Entrophospora sp. SA101]CAJ0926272.1 18307_t:CDS:2 [Entrophospora sp. SA101]